MNIGIPEGYGSLLVTSLVNVRYLTGFSGSSGCALITPRQRLFFTDFRYRQQAAGEVRDFSTRIVNGQPAVAAVKYARTRRMKLGVLGYEAAGLSHRTFLELKRNLRGVQFKAADGVVERQRAIKTSPELAAIRRAAAIADDALGKLVRRRVTGRTENEVAWMLERWMREAGSQALPFGIIVASGRRSAMPHGAASEKVIRKNELVVIDLGARVDGYGSDITRTFATGSLPRSRRLVYDTVLEAQARSLAAVAPGVPCADVDAVARGYIDAAGYGGAFGHSLGHGVGLEPHEAPALAPRSRDRLSVGMVVTVEPGIYVERTGGVRIEDTVAVTATGAERLTRFPRGLRLLR